MMWVVLDAGGYRKTALLKYHTCSPNSVGDVVKKHQKIVQVYHREPTLYTSKYVINILSMSSTYYRWYIFLRAGAMFLGHMPPSPFGVLTMY